MANINTSRKSGFIIRAGVKRRETVWSGILETLTVLANAGDAVLFGGFSAAALALRPFTIVRTRLLHYVSSDQSGVDESWMAAIGFAIVTDEALAVGATAVPTPLSSSDSDAFFVWNAITGRQEFVSAAGFNDTGRMVMVDSKAMRKVEDGFDIAISIQNGSSPFLGTVTIKVGRMLLKLH